MTIGGMEYWLDLQGGQKTGFYLDQRFQHAVVSRHAAGGRVLDAFCNQGAFALHAARAGAVEVLGLDSAEDAVAAARRNAEKNGLRAEFAVAVRSDLKRRGIGRLLMTRILDHARARGIGEVTGSILRENVAMVALARDFGFAIEDEPGAPALLRARIATGAARG